MSNPEATQSKTTNAQAVDEEYEKLERFHVERRRIVFFKPQDPSQGGFGIVLRAELHESAYLPTWLASRRYGRPQLVAVKQIKIPPAYNVPRVKRAFTREMLVWSSAGEHPGITKFLGFYADFDRSEAWLLSPWEPNGNVSDFVKKNNLEVPEKLSLIYDTIDALTFLHQLTPPVCHGDIKSVSQTCSNLKALPKKKRSGESKLSGNSTMASRNGVFARHMFRISTHSIDASLDLGRSLHGNWSIVGRAHQLVTRLQLRHRCVSSIPH